MPVACCVYNCKNTWKKNSKIKFYRFPFKKNEEVMKYWIAATGHNNWFPYSDARICSVHFTDNDYHNNKEHIKRRHLKPDVIPTQNIHASILQMLQEDTHTLQMSQVEKIHEFNEYDQSVIQIKEELINEGCEATSASPKHDQSVIQINEELINEGCEATSASPKHDQSVIQINEELINEGCEATSASPKHDQSVIQINEELINEGCEATSASPKRSLHFNYDELINENKKLKQLIHDLQESVEERLNKQANMFHKLMNKKEAIYKKKLEMTRNKTKTLNKNIQRKRKKITNIRTLFKELKGKNMLENDDAISLSNQFGNLLVPLLKNEKKNKDKHSRGRRYSEEINI